MRYCLICGSPARQNEDNDWVCDCTCEVDFFEGNEDKILEEILIREGFVEAA